MTTPEPEAARPDVASGTTPPPITPLEELPPVPQSPMMVANGAPKLPQTPVRNSHKPLPKEPAMTPRLKKRMPWRNGKNIMVLLPRDEDRGQRGHAPRPLRQEELERVFMEWEELGYDVNGFDLLVEGYQPPGTDDSQSRDMWPNADDILAERAQRSYQVTLPDLNAWKDYVNELQEAKLRALGVFTAEDDPEPEPEPEQLVSPPLSRNASAQYPPLPFSPPLPPGSAASNGMGGYPFPQQFMSGPGSGTQSPALGARNSPFGVNGKFNPRQSISIPASHSPFNTPPDWLNQNGFVPGMNRGGSPSLMNMNGLMSPQSPFGLDGMQQSTSPGLQQLHQRHQSLQYPMLQHQFQQQPAARASPRLQEVREDEEEETGQQMPGPSQQNNPDSLQAEIDDAEYHLEEQMRNQFEHADYNPQAQGERLNARDASAVNHNHEASNNGFPTPELFAAKSSEPLVLHHPRPHSRGHSLTKNAFQEAHEVADANDKPFSALNDIPEAPKGDDVYEIETNPSNLGTPVQAFDFALPAGQHQKTISTGSNPWQASTVPETESRRSSHGSKPSLSKLNVKAPEFKFNPASTFTPGQQFTFGGNAFQPAIFPGNTEPQQHEPPPVASNIVQFGSTPQVSSFSPGQTDFSFSSSGPKFRPDAPAFTPFQQSFSGSVTSPTMSGSESVGNRSSIFGNIEIPRSDAVKPAKKSKAIPIVRPTSQSSAKSIKLTGTDTEDNDDADGRPLVDESRIKRAWSSAPDGDDVPAFAEQPDLDKEKTPTVESINQARDDLEEGEIEEDIDAGAEPTLPIDTSLSSIVTSDHQLDTKATTAAPSESSPDYSGSGYPPFEFDDKFEASNFDQSRTFGDDMFQPTHKKSLSASAPTFTPNGSIFSLKGSTFSPTAPTFSPNAPAFVPGQTRTSLDVSQRAVPEPEEKEEEEHNEVSPMSSVGKGPVEPIREVSPPPAPKQRVVSKGLGASRFASPPAKPAGLATSRFASEPSPPPQDSEGAITPRDEFMPDQDFTPQQHEVMRPSVEDDQEFDQSDLRSPTFEEIDDIMAQLGSDPSRGVNKTVEQNPAWQGMQMPFTSVASSDPFKLDPPGTDRQIRPSTSPAPPTYFAEQPLPESVPHSTQTTPLEDPFVDPPLTSPSLRNGEANDEPELPQVSDWEKDFSEEEHSKLHGRSPFFDGRVNEVVGSLLSSRLEPLERALLEISANLGGKARRAPSSRRDMRSVSAELQESDADDEDEEPVLRRSMSPQRDRRMNQIRVAVMEGLAAQQRELPVAAAATVSEDPAAESAVLKALAEMKVHLGENIRQNFSGDDLRATIEEAVERKMAPKPDDEATTKMDELSAKLLDMEQQLQAQKDKVEREVSERRAAEDMAAELNRKLQSAETRVEVEIINRSVFDQRVTDLEERLRAQETKTEEEVTSRRAAEDRLSENQRLLRISAEEESRLREVIEERDVKVKTLEHDVGEKSAHMTLLEASQATSMQAQSEMTNTINALETDLRNVRQDNHHWRAEAERADEQAHRTGGELAHVKEENKHMQKSLTTLSTQLGENERLREAWRTKFMSLQEDMAKASQEIAHENASRIKKEQTMLARQDVLDARLQAESKTRERLEVEMDRLQMNERSAMRAVNECKRLEGLLGEMKTENHKLADRAAQHKRDYEEAREIGASEVKRVRMSLQIEIDSANDQVNVVREELEEQNNKLRAELDNFKLEADTAKAKNEMLLEEAQSTKAGEVDELKEKHQNELENIQARHEHQLGMTTDEAQKTESHLLERLSFSTSKIEHLQDRVVHLEEKLEVAKEAAAAAAQAAKAAGADVGHTTPIAPTAASAIAKPAASVAQKLDVPEKISPQALRESIMVLQEQLQAREQRIEELESTVSKLDPEAPTKITKRDDEISWLRELLAVRHGDLQDIIAALSGENFNRERVKDAAIRLKANLQMEEQERERALNGGSALNLPSIVQSASPRVAQAVGPLAAAWGNWRKGSSSSFSSMAAALNSPVNDRRVATPSRSRGPPPRGNSNLGGLMTPPASGLRQSPLVEDEDDEPQPTAFASTGRRFPAQSGRNREGSHSGNPRPRGNSNMSARQHQRGESHSSRRAEKMPVRDVESTSEEEITLDDRPITPPMMMHKSGYDSDAQPGDFDDHDFFED